MNCVSASSDFQRLKAKLKTIWTSGDYDVFCTYLEPSAAHFFRRLEVPSGARFLDVACGSGQVALMAAAEGAHVTGVDLADNLVHAARVNAKRKGLRAQFDQGDAESLPYENHSFDFVVSVIGAMFAPAPDVVATELTRVCRPGGTIAMANWTADGFVGKMFRAIAGYIAPSGMPSPLLWGDEQTVTNRFGKHVDQLRLSRHHYLLQYPFPPEQVVEFFQTYYGPMACAFAELEPAARNELRSKLVALWTEHNEAKDSTTLVRGEYLEVIAKRSANGHVSNG